MNPLTRLPKIPSDQITPLIAELLGTIQLQMEEIQFLKDEIARLKGQKPKPKIKPSNLEKETDKKKSSKKKPTSRKKSKTKKLEINQDIPLKPENLPPGSKFKGYQDYVVQDLILASWNIRYRRERWQTPSGDYAIGQLPENIDGHFSSSLVSFVLYQHYGCCVTQPLILEQLHELGVDISSGQVNNIIINNKERFHNEKDLILSTGLQISNYINVDDTGARHKGQNGYCTHIGNEYFAWFESTPKKNRINFLEILRVEHMDYVINSDAIEYMSVHGLPDYQVAKFMHIKGEIFNDRELLATFLFSNGIVSNLHIRIATEGALVGSIISHGYNKDLAIISDDAGQFNVFLHALCWVHAERTIHKLIGFTTEQQELLKETRSDIWQLYRDLKEYQLQPDKNMKLELENRFDELFTRKTGFATLDLALKRIHLNKSELLLVLARPDIPLHNNLSERDIREYVKRRKISGSTRSDIGKKCRDTFTSLKKTCRKLKISFWDYLNDRISNKNKIPPIPDVMKFQVAQSGP